MNQVQVSIQWKAAILADDMKHIEIQIRKVLEGEEEEILGVQGHLSSALFHKNHLLAPVSHPEQKDHSLWNHHINSGKHLKLHKTIQHYKLF